VLNLIFTLDYEIHGNGDGNPDELMVEPTARLLDLLDRYGAKLTIMADVAEILKFREYRDQFGRDDYHYNAIVAQLRDAIARRHDVQLHLHCSYFNARFENGKWNQDWTEYNFAGLSEDRINEVLQVGKSFLENELRPVDPNYRCYAFRAANWAVSPSRNVVRALINNGFEIDTSVFKFGRRDGLVSFDYSHAPDSLGPWRADEEDICRENPVGKLLEFPIYSERRWLGAFVSWNRIQRVLSSRSHRLQQNGATAKVAGSARRNRFRKILLPFQRHAWKADFNQCTGRQLSSALKRASTTVKRNGQTTRPLVLIGHSKLFSRANERQLEIFLQEITQPNDTSHFATFRSFASASESMIRH
jgi:hypothetical protein